MQTNFVKYNKRCSWVFAWWDCCCVCFPCDTITKVFFLLFLIYFVFNYNFIHTWSVLIMVENTYMQLHAMLENNSCGFVWLYQQTQHQVISWFILTKTSEDGITSKRAIDSFFLYKNTTLIENKRTISSEGYPSLPSRHTAGLKFEKQTLFSKVITNQ